MGETATPLRKTIYTDEETVKRCEILFGEAKVDSFSAFVAKALDSYIRQLASLEIALPLRDRA